MLNEKLTVARMLVQMAGLYPDRPAVLVPRESVRRNAETPHHTWTFSQLNSLSDALAHGLETIGVNRGTRVAVMVPPGIDFFVLTFALMKIAAIPVMIDPGMGLKNLGKCLAEAGPQAFIGIRKAHLARRLMGWARQTVRVTVNAGTSRFFCHASTAELIAKGQSRGPYELPDLSPDDLAAILFTSGSTGIAKGVQYTHGIFSAQVRMLQSIFGIQPGEVDLCTFPLFALFGPALGMTCIVPEMNPSRPATLDPWKALSQIRQFHVTNIFGSPAVIRRMCELPGDTRLSTIRRAISAGAPANAKVIEAFARMLPDGVQVFTPYGATEALPVCNIGSLEIVGETRHLTEQGHGVCVGKPVAGNTVYIIPISDHAIDEWKDDIPVSQGTIGEIVVRGPTVTPRYDKRDEATRLAKITDRKTGEILHRMGDVGYLDDRGRLWFCGRKSHRVVTAAGTLYTDQVEPILNTVPGVARTALVGVTYHSHTMAVVCVERTPDSRLPWSELAKSLLMTAKKHQVTQNIVHFLDHPGFPVDIRHNSKIFREKLAIWAQKRVGKLVISEPANQGEAS